MDYLMKAEQRYREHYDRVAHVNAEGWKSAKVGRRCLTTVVAHALVVLAIRLDKSATPPPSSARALAN